MEVASSPEVAILGETRALSYALMIINMSVSTCTIIIIVHVVPTFAMPILIL